MRRSEKEIKSPAELQDVMKKAMVCRLGLADGDIPYVVPMNFGLMNNALYFHAAKEGRKLEIIRRNNKVCFEMDTDHVFVPAENGCNWSMKYRSVIGYGKVHLLDSPTEKIAALKIIMAHYADEYRSGKVYDFSEIEAARVTVFRIDIESVSGKKSGY
jgi:nitroimidazol reductase NimA-like FMN-containing flavoprotein (pyridoxamine 5'-phosphate oxidase superfamily)